MCRIVKSKIGSPHRIGLNSVLLHRGHLPAASNVAGLVKSLAAFLECIPERRIIHKPFYGVAEVVSDESVFNHGTEQWSVVYQNTYAILSVEAHMSVSDQVPTFLLLTLGLLGLVSYQQRLLPKLLKRFRLVVRAFASDQYASLEITVRLRSRADWGSNSCSSLERAYAFPRARSAVTTFRHAPARFTDRVSVADESRLSQSSARCHRRILHAFKKSEHAKKSRDGDEDSSNHS
jgi:hypothetical protein